MAVAYDTVVDAQEVGGDAVLSVTIAATGENRAAFIGRTNSAASGGKLGSVSYGGSAATELWDFLHDISSAGDQDAANAGYYFIAPPTALTTVVGTLAATPDEHFIGVITLTGVDQTSPVGTPQMTTNFGQSSISVTVTDVTADDLLCDNLYVYDPDGLNPAAGANQTKRYDEGLGATTLTFRGSTQDGADGGVMSWSDTATWAGASLGAVAYKPVTGYQYARPDADVTDGGWFSNTGTQTNLYSFIDEASATDSDFIETSTSTTGLWTMTPVTSVGSGTYILRYRAAGDASSNLIAYIGVGTAAGSFSSVQSFTEVGVPTAVTAFAHTVTGTFSDTTKLSIKFEAT